MLGQKRTCLVDCPTPCTAGSHPPSWVWFSGDPGLASKAGGVLEKFQAKLPLHPPFRFPFLSPVSQRGLGSLGKLKHKAEFQELQAEQSPGCFLSSFLLLLKGLWLSPVTFQAESWLMVFVLPPSLPHNYTSLQQLLRILEGHPAGKDRI